MSRTYLVNGVVAGRPVELGGGSCNPAPVDACLKGDTAGLIVLMMLFLPAILLHSIGIENLYIFFLNNISDDEE